MDTKDKALRYRSQYFEKNGEYPSVIYLEPEDYREILNCNYTFSGTSKPRPPIKREVKRWVPGGLFSSGGYDTEIEYDHHAPEYLKQLEEWKVEQDNFSKNHPNGMIFGMSIRLKE